MKFAPLLRLCYTTSINEGQILASIKQHTYAKDWDFKLDNAINNKVFESEITGNRFLIVRARYGLTYGRTSLLPVMKGRITTITGSEPRTTIKIIIRLFGKGLFILLPFYGIAMMGFLKGLGNRDIKLIFFSLLFITVTYTSILIKFNKEVKNYVDFVEKKLLAGGFIKN